MNDVSRHKPGLPEETVPRGATAARRELGVTIGLTIVIPLLAFVFLLLHAAPENSQAVYALGVLVTLVAVISACVGAVLALRHPLHVARLRREVEAEIRQRLGSELCAACELPDLVALEHGLQTLVQQVQVRVDGVQMELRRLNDILDRHGGLARAGGPRERPLRRMTPPGDPAAALRQHVQPTVLEALMTDVLDLTESVGVVYDEQRVPVLALMAAGWSQGLCSSSSSWVEPEVAPAGAFADGSMLEPTIHTRAGQCIDAREALDVPADIGGRVLLVPVCAGERVVGALGIHYGATTRDPAVLKALANRYGVPSDVLALEESSAPVLPDFVAALARNRLRTTASLLGESITRARTEAELRDQQGRLAATVQARTQELQESNLRLEQEIAERRQVETLKDEFVSTVSHELRTPLAITKEGIALLLDGIPGAINEKQRKVLQSAKGNIDRLARIINDLLDMSKIEAGKMEMKKDRVDFVDLADGVVVNFAVAAQQKGLRLETHWALTSREVYADFGRIVQVLTNLVSNAVKFTRAGRVRVLAVNGAEGVTCTVEDSGVGLSRSELVRVFDKFVQFGRVDGAGEKGTGLGLAIARQIVELHRGRLWVESEVDRGSRFFFTLPLYSEHEVVRETIEGAIAEARAAKEEFLVLLFELGDARTLADPARRAQFAQGFQQLRIMQNLARASDRMITRGDRQVIMAARVTPSQLAGLYRRWKLQVEACFREVDPGLDVRLSCGYAHYPEDGTVSGELIQQAEATLSPLDGGDHGSFI